MATRAEMVDDIILRIYGSKPSDDIELEKSQVSYWIDITSNAILSDYCKRLAKEGKELPSKFFKREVDKQLIKETGVNYDNYQTEFRYYFETLHTILPLNKDKGVVRVNDNYGRNLSPVLSKDSDWMVNLPYGGITTAEQSFYVEEGSKVFVEQSTSSTQATYYYDILYVPEISDLSVLDSAEFPLDADLIKLVLDEVEALARRQMSGIADLDNDGKDPYHK